MGAIIGWILILRPSYCAGDQHAINQKIGCKKISVDPTQKVRFLEKDLFRSATGQIHDNMS